MSSKKTGTANKNPSTQHKEFLAGRAENNLLVCLDCREVSASLVGGFCTTCASKKKNASQKRLTKDEEYVILLRRQKGLPDEKDDE